MTNSHLDRTDINPGLRHRLRTLIHEKKVPHFLIFHASQEEYAATLAKAFLFDWLGISSLEMLHPDFLVLEPEGKLSLHTLENIKSFLHELTLEPFKGKKRGVIIRDADKMLPSSSNALLKALEEAPISTVIVGTTSQPHRILSTIRSRAHEIACGISAEQTDNEYVSRVIELMHANWPLSTFSQLFSVCDSIEKLLDGEAQTRARESLDAVVSFVLEKSSPELRKSCLRAYHEASQALDKNVSIRDAFLLFLNGI